MLSSPHSDRSQTAAMGWSVVAATLAMMALLTVQLPAGVYVKNLCVYVFLSLKALSHDNYKNYF